jgi:hypothetical protein
MRSVDVLVQAVLANGGPVPAALTITVATTMSQIATPSRGSLDNVNLNRRRCGARTRELALAEISKRKPIESSGDRDGGGGNGDRAAGVGPSAGLLSDIPTHEACLKPRSRP